MRFPKGCISIGFVTVALAIVVPQQTRADYLTLAGLVSDCREYNYPTAAQHGDEAKACEEYLANRFNGFRYKALEDKIRSLPPTDGWHTVWGKNLLPWATQRWGGMLLCKRKLSGGGTRMENPILALNAAFLAWADQQTAVSLYTSSASGGFDDFLATLLLSAKDVNSDGQVGLCFYTADQAALIRANEIDRMNRLRAPAPLPPLFLDCMAITDDIINCHGF